MYLLAEQNLLTLIQIKKIPQSQEIDKGKKIKRDGTISRIPADFIIDENGVITITYYGTNIGDHLALNKIL